MDSITASQFRGSSAYALPSPLGMAGGLELLLAGSIRIFGIASPFGRSRGLGYQLAVDTRQP
jgi:hypothetical protein